MRALESWDRLAEPLGPAADPVMDRLAGDPQRVADRALAETAGVVEPERFELRGGHHFLGDLEQLLAGGAHRAEAYDPRMNVMPPSAGGLTLGPDERAD